MTYTYCTTTLSGDVGTSADERLQTRSGQPQKGAVWSHCYSANGGSEWDMHSRHVNTNSYRFRLYQ